MSLPAPSNPAPLSPAQLWALAAGAARELSWGLRAVSTEMARWRARAEAIPDPRIRRDALTALRHKRGHADGAALFTILPRRREPALLRALVGYESIIDFLDNVHERHPTHANGQRLHLALLDAMAPGQPTRDYYRFHPWEDDGGYLAAFVTSCQRACGALPSFVLVRELVRREAQRALVLGLNHEPDPIARDARLRAWARRECDEDHELRWFELSGAASASLVVLALLTLAADPRATSGVATATHQAMWPWSGFATTMLDSYADQHDDCASNAHSYVDHYDSMATTVARIRYALGRTLDGVAHLDRPYHHKLIIACMAALYLSKHDMRTPAQAPSTDAIADAGGTLVKILLPILRTWRLAYRQHTC